MADISRQEEERRVTRRWRSPDEHIDDLTEEVADAQAVIAAAESVLWMAKEYAEAGGAHGPEMRDYRKAAEALAQYRLWHREPLTDSRD